MQYQTLMTLLLPIGLLACGTGRSSDVKQNTIEQNYTLTYQEATAQLKASAGFYYENTLGTSLKLTGDSSIAFNGKPMEYSNPLNSAMYYQESQVVTAPVNLMDFRYVNNDGEVFITKTRVPAATSVRLPRDGDSVPGNSELRVDMQGEAIQGGDAVTLCLVYDSGVSGQSPIHECLRSEKGLSLVFSREQLARFPVDHELTLELRREAHPKQSNARIHLTQTFVAKPVHITLQ